MVDSNKKVAAIIINGHDEIRISHPIELSNIDKRKGRGGQQGPPGVSGSAHTPTLLLKHNSRMSNPYHLVKLVGSTALCLDGSNGAFYFQRSPVASTTWQIFQEGGGWCYDEMECSERALTDLGSSNNYPSVAYDKSGPSPNLNAGGLLSSDCSVNPTFCDANKVPNSVIFNCTYTSRMLRSGNTFQIPLSTAFGWKRST